MPVTVWLFSCTVFITGASTLIIEVLATRLLAPYFGNTVITLASVLSVILLALACGYALGGRLADRVPSQKLFFGLITVSGGSTLLLSLLVRLMLPAWAPELNPFFGPVMAALILFFVPAFLLGMLSPFAVVLSLQPGSSETLGRVTGRIFFWSTAGSIVGSLAAGFWLIPYVGSMLTLLLVAGGLMAVGLLGWLWSGAQTSQVLVAGVFSLGAASLYGFVPNPPAGVVHVEETMYQEVAIVDQLFQGRPTRFFLQDRNPSGAQFLDATSPTDLPFEYTKFYEMAKLENRPVERALIMGGGIDSIARALLHDFPQVEVTAIEVDGALQPLVRKYFGGKDDARLHHVVGDGRQFLKQTNEQYDLIFSDVYYSFSIPFHLATREFFALAKKHLTPQGLMLANFVGRLVPEDPSLLLAAMHTFRRVFPASDFFVTDETEWKAGQNIVFAGWAKTSPPILALPGAQQTNPLFWAKLPVRHIDTSELGLEAYPLYTDDRSAIEYALARLVGRLEMRPVSQFFLESF